MSEKTVMQLQLQAATSPSPRSGWPSKSSRRWYSKTPQTILFIHIWAEPGAALGYQSYIWLWIYLAQRWWRRSYQCQLSWHKQGSTCGGRHRILQVQHTPFSLLFFFYCLLLFECPDFCFFLLLLAQGELWQGLVARDCWDSQDRCSIKIFNLNHLAMLR